jgi:protein involved in polysaccharide export with SLBB domain
MLLNRLLLTAAIFLCEGIALGQSFSVIGEVQHPGNFPLTKSTSVLQAIAAAGGLTNISSTKKAVIIRDGGNVPVNLKKSLGRHGTGYSLAG